MCTPLSTSTRKIKNNLYLHDLANSVAAYTAKAGEMFSKLERLSCSGTRQKKLSRKRRENSLEWRRPAAGHSMKRRTARVIGDEKRHAENLVSGRVSAPPTVVKNIVGTWMLVEV